MQGTLREDCAAESYQKYSDTNIQKLIWCNLIHFKIIFLLINLTVIVKFNKSCVLCQCQNVMLVTIL